MSVLTALNMPMKSMYTFPSTSCVRLVRVEICESHIFFLSSDSPITEILDPFSKKKKKKKGRGSKPPALTRLSRSKSSLARGLNLRSGLLPLFDSIVVKTQKIYEESKKINFCNEKFSGDCRIFIPSSGV